MAISNRSFIVTRRLRDFELLVKLVYSNNWATFYFWWTHATNYENKYLGQYTELFGDSDYNTRMPLEFETKVEINNGACEEDIYAVKYFRCILSKKIGAVPSF